MPRQPLSVLLLGLLLAAGPVSLARSGPPPAQALGEAKVQAARRAYEASVKALSAGHADAEKVYVWSRRLMEAQRGLAKKKADQVAAVEAHLGRMKELRKVT